MCTIVISISDGHTTNLAHNKSIYHNESLEIFIKVLLFDKYVEQNNKYYHTQIGWLSAAVMGVSIASIVFIMLIVPFNTVAFTIMSFVLIVLAICLVVFSSMNVSCDGNTLKIRLGFIVGKSFPLKDIKSCRVIKVPWYYGWGVRSIPNGWLYRVSGSYAVEIHIGSKRYLIGSDDPQKLLEFIKRHTGT
jgi:hypothetical protein